MLINLNNMLFFSKLASVMLLNDMLIKKTCKKDSRASRFAQIWPNVPKDGHFGPKLQFLRLSEKTAPNIFSKIALTVGPKIVLLDKLGQSNFSAL